MTYSANYNNKNALQTLNLQGIDFMIYDPAGTRTVSPKALCLKASITIIFKGVSFW